MIPKIDVRSLVANKIYTGELAFEFEAVDLLDLPFVEFSSPVKAELNYEIFEDNSVEVRGRFTYTLKGACSRCLSETQKTFSAEVEGVFEQGKGDGETYGYANSVDLGEFLRESLCFTLPSRLLCGECESSYGENE